MNSLGISLQGLAQSCISQYKMTTQLIMQVDTLTRDAHSTYTCLPQCEEAWKIVEESFCFWENIYLLLIENTAAQTKIQALVVMETRVKKSWRKEPEAVRESIMEYLWNQAKAWNASADPIINAFFRKINQIIAIVLKLEWRSSWQHILTVICSSIEEDAYRSQNYFDMLYSIISEAQHKEAMLTREEFRDLTRMFVDHFPQIQDCFQRYLVIQTPFGALENCMRALEAISVLVSVESMTMGYVIEKLLSLLEDLVKAPNFWYSREDKKQTQDSFKEQLKILENYIKIRECWELCVRCLLSIVEQTTTKSNQQVLPKLYHKKMEIMIKVVIAGYGQKQHSRPRILEEIMESAIGVLGELENENQRYCKFLAQQGVNVSLEVGKLIFQDLEITQKYQQMVLMLSKMLVAMHDHSPYRFEDEVSICAYKEYIRLYKFVTQFLEHDRSLSHIVNEAPLPISTTYFQIMGFEQIIVQSFEQEAFSYREVMKAVIKSKEKEYVHYVLETIDKYFKQDGDHPVQLHKLVWSIYYYLDLCVNSHQVKTSLFAFISQLLKLEKKLQMVFECDPTQQKKKSMVINESTETQTHKLKQLSKLRLLKPSICMLLSHKKCMVDYKLILLDPYLAYLSSLTRQSNKAYIIFALEVLFLTYSQLGQKGRYQFHVDYIKSMDSLSNQNSNLEARVDTDTSYLKAVGLWKPFTAEEIQEKRQICVVVLKPYKDQLQAHLAIQVDAYNQQQISKFEAKFTKISRNYMSVAGQAAVGLRELIIPQILADLQIMEQAQNRQKNFTFFTQILSLSSQCLSLLPKEYLGTVSSQQMSSLISHSYIMVAQLLRLLYNSEFETEIILDYLAIFLQSYAHWNIDHSMKLDTVHRILNAVFVQDFNYSIKGSSLFLNSVVQFMRIVKMPNNVLSMALVHLLHPSVTSTQLSTTEFLETLQILLNPNSMNPCLYSFLQSHMLDIFTSVFRLFLQSPISMHYIPQYTSVMMVLLSYPYIHSQLGSILKVSKQEAVSMMDVVINKHYSHLDEAMANRITKFLTYLVGVTERAEFQEKLDDLLVVLKRGF